MKQLTGDGDDQMVALRWCRMKERKMKGEADGKVSRVGRKKKEKECFLSRPKSHENKEKKTLLGQYHMKIREESLCPKSKLIGKLPVWSPEFFIALTFFFVLIKSQSITTT